MPLSSVSIEQTTPDQWIAEFEMGAPVCRRVRLRGDGLRAILDAIDAAYCDLTGGQTMRSHFERELARTNDRLAETRAALAKAQTELARRPAHSPQRHAS